MTEERLEERIRDLEVEVNRLRNKKNKRWTVVAIVFIVVMSLLTAASVTKDYTFSTGQTISSSQVNANFDTLYTLVNGNINSANLFSDAASLAKVSGGLMSAVSGNIGIGTVSPGQKLTVAGIVESTSGGVKFPDGTTQSTAALGNDNLGNHVATQNIVTNDHWISGDGSNNGIFVDKDAANQVLISSSGSVPLTVSGLMTIESESGPAANLYLYSSGTTSVRLAASGNSYLNGGKLGIGTSSPLGKLDVNGTIYQRGTQIHADYVFKEGYHIESIADHAAYMWREKHLPAIPESQKDENGSDIVEYGVHVRGLLEEIETAHIYIEQLLVRINDLETRIKRIEQ